MDAVRETGVLRHTSRITKTACIFICIQSRLHISRTTKIISTVTQRDFTHCILQTLPYMQNARRIGPPSDQT